jgi:DNA repair protein RecO (recombination protein O)
MANATCGEFFIRSGARALQIGRVITTRGIVVRLTKLTDTSLIVHWCTADHGLVKTVARGARRPKSAFAGKLDLFFSCEITVANARRGALDTLCEVVLENGRDGLRRSWPAALMAGYFCRLCEAVVEPGHPDAEMFDLLRRGLDHLDSQQPTLRALRHFEAELAKCLGISSHPDQAEGALRESLGALPATRGKILELFSPP